MAQKPKPRPPTKPKKAEKEKPQAERFKETARKLGVDETGEEFERIVSRILTPARRKGNGG